MSQGARKLFHLLIKRLLNKSGGQALHPTSIIYLFRFCFTFAADFLSRIKDLIAQLTLLRNVNTSIIYEFEGKSFYDRLFMELLHTVPGTKVQRKGQQKAGFGGGGDKTNTDIDCYN